LRAAALPELMQTGPKKKKKKKKKKAHLISMQKHMLHPFLMLVVTLKSVTMIAELHPRLLHLFQFGTCRF
jgi:hypothetical protein